LSNGRQRRTSGGKRFGDILSTCFFLLSYEKGPDNARIIRNIIDDVLASKNRIFQTSGTGEKFRVVSSFVLPIIGIILPTTIAFYPQWGPTLTSIFSYEAVGVILLYALSFPLAWIVRGRSWYKTLIRIHDVEKKEKKVYTALIPVQRVVLNYAFPNIKGLLDEK